MQVTGESRGVSRRWVGASARAMSVMMLLGAFLAQPTTAQVSVSSGGTPSYGVNIGVPPGIAGMSPNLSLVYTGGGVNGPLGYGWTLTGVSLITRCAGNLATDGVPVAVTYAPTDRLCLDGQRLIQTSTSGVPVATTPAANGALLDANGRAEDGSYTEYRTEKDIYSRIRAYGMANGSTANGPRYFKVWTKAGQIYEYGAGPSSDLNSNSLITPYGGTIVAAWASSRISDTVGNFIDFKYSYRDIAWGSGPSTGATMGHEWNVAEIQYTGNGNQFANNKVVFEYEDRPDTPGSMQDRSEAYHDGYKNVSVQRLKAVRSYVNWPSSSLGVKMPGGAPVNADGTAPPGAAVKVKTLKIGYELGPISGRSRVITTQECAGTAETACLPKTSIAYAPPATSDAYIANANFSGTPLSTLQLTNASGTLGVILGDFNGDGKTDVIRWSDTPSQNVMYTSNGDGTFTPDAAFNLTGVQLFRSDGCYASVAMDFNGDGLTDILRVMLPTAPSGSSCGTPVNLLYLSKGDGTFAAPITLPSSISLQQSLAVSSQIQSCLIPNVIGVSSQPVSNAGVSSPQVIGNPVCPNPYWVYSQTQGANYHILDVNGDGLPDIVTTIEPAYSNQTSVPAPDSLCLDTTCTQVFVASLNGMTAGPNAVAAVSFKAIPTNLANHTVYGPPRPSTQWHVYFRPYVADFDGDGLLDLQVDSGGWRSLGNGNFQLTGSSGACLYPLDFNGDGRSDCLGLPISPPGASSVLTIGGRANNNTIAAGFNLSGPGILAPTKSPAPVGSAVGVVLADLDGDGRTDIIRWADDPTKNMAYLSNGDGTFRTSDILSNLSSTASPLQKSDGSVSFLTGDFTGNGQTEILRMVSTITAGSPTTTNQLFVRPSAVQPEELSSITPPSGLTSTVTFVSLLNANSGSLGPRYQPGRQSGAPAVYPKIDISVPIRVVQTVETASGVGVLTTKDEYAYSGLRATFDGHGFLGFQTVSEQHSAADGSPLTTVTSYLQDGAYIGVAGTSKTLDGPLNAPSAPIISRTTNSYCDTTSGASAAAVTAPGTAPATCTTTSLVQRPYLYQSLEEGWDIDANRTALPKVTTTNAFSGSGDATQISVSTAGTALGLSQVVTKVTNNTFLPDNTAGDTWILGRLQQSTQTNTVPNTLASIATSAGTAKYATATTGESLGASLTVPAFPTTYLGQSSTVSATLQNTSTGALGITPPTAASVTGTDFSFVSTTCSSTLAQGASCTVTILFTPSAAVTRTGTVTVKNEANQSSAGLSGLGAASAAVLTLSNCSSSTPTIAPAAATMSCQLGNTGQTAASSIGYASTAAGTTASGPASCAANTSNCGTATVTTSTSAGTYAGNLVATPNSGSAAQASFSLLVNTPAALSLTACNQVSPTVGTTPASMSCTVSNTGQTAASGIVYSSTKTGMTLSAGPTSCAANTGNCGSVTVTSPATPATYAGNLVATPANGPAASAPFNLTVYTVPALTLASCSANAVVTAPAQASMTCTVSNSGQAAASGIVYASSIAGMSISGGPTTCAGGSASCGTVTVTSPATAGSYGGALTATPASGTAASASFSFQVNTPVALTLTACSGAATAVTPATASMSCTLGNSGQTAASGIVYTSGASGMSYTGPTSCAASASNCGTVVVTTPSAVGGYSGTLVATPSTGTAATAAFNLSVNTPPALALVSCSQNSPTVATQSASMTCAVSNAGQTAASAITYASSLTGMTVSAGPTTCAAGSSNCGSVTVSTPGTAQAYSGNLVATPSNGVAASAPFNLTVYTPPALTLSACSATTGVTAPAHASTTCTVGNTGQAAAAGITYASSNASTTISGGPTSCAGGASSCGSVTVTSPATAGSYGGSLTATPASGNPASVSFALQVNSAPQLTLTACSANTNVVTPSQASQTCTLGNTGQTAASSITYSVTPAGMSAGGPTSCAANNGNCGTVTVTSPSGVNTYNGSVTATPASGSAATTIFSLVVLGQPALSLAGCSTVTAQTPPAQSTFSCTVGNSGPSAASGITYGTTASGVSISGGPTSCGASNSNCGTVTVTAPAVAGTYAGNLTVAPALGSSATASFSLHENSLASLAFINCSTVSPSTSPAQASTTCTLLNNGDNASGVIFGNVSPTQPAGVVSSGSSNTCAGHSTCGPWAMTTSNGGTYSGTVTASLVSGMGTGASFTFNLTENAPVITAFALVSSTGLSSTFQNNNASAVTVINSGISGGSVFPVLTTNTCTGSIAAGGKCTITFTAPNPDCPADNYTASAFVQDIGGTQSGQSVPRNVTSGVCM